MVSQPLSGLLGSTEVSSVADKIALSDAGLRKFMVSSILAAFIFANGAILLGVWCAFRNDVELLTRAASGFTAKDRLVTTELLMTLVGATTVQLGGLVVLMGKYLFPAPKP